MTDKANVRRRIILAVFILYALAILFFLIIPNDYRGHNVYVGGITWARWADFVRRNVNLTPFRTLSAQIGDIFAGRSAARNLVYFIGNFAGFAPLGFFLPALFARRRKFLVFLITVIPTIAVLELVQVITMRGSFDIDDIILNTAGACAGFWITRKSKARNKRDCKCN